MRFKISLPPGPANEERHHIFPRNAGGDDGPLVSLCDSHHATLHKIANRFHTKKPYVDLLLGENEIRAKRLLWLASQVYKAEKLAVDDPNKRFQNSVQLHAEDLEMLKRLQKLYPKRSRSDIVRAALTTFYRQKLGTKS